MNLLHIDARLLLKAAHSRVAVIWFYERPLQRSLVRSDHLAPPGGPEREWATPAGAVMLETNAAFKPVGNNHTFTRYI